MKIHERNALMPRMSMKAKIIIALVLLVLVAFGLVVAFAAGFVTGAVLKETSLRDDCIKREGVWNAENEMCAPKVIAPAPLPYSSTADEYACGDQSRFTLESISTTTTRFALAGAAPRDLAVITEGILTRYEDAMVAIVPDGIDATYTNKQMGTSVACTMVNPQESQE